MLILLACQCGGSEPMVRSTLQSAGVKDWLKVPVKKGKQASLDWMDMCPDYIKSTLEWGALRNFIVNHGKFAVVVGYNDHIFKWSDVAAGSLQAKLDAEVIAKKFETTYNKSN